jgi:hypothetical protein
VGVGVLVGIGKGVSVGVADAPAGADTVRLLSALLSDAKKQPRSNIAPKAQAIVKRCLIGVMPPFAAIVATPTRRVKE